MRKKRECILGLDLSLRAAAGAVLRPDWQPGDWDIPTHVAGYPIEAANRSPEASAQRLWFIAEELLAFAKEHNVTSVFVEDAAYGLAGRSGVVLAELAGAVKYAFRARLKLVVVPVNASTVRKYFLGKLPRKNHAAAVYDALTSIGCPLKTSDEKDAFAVANYGRTELGLPGITVAC
jgi:Holliday junction resolvasome RuvABC endonuclease subunit